MPLLRAPLLGFKAQGSIGKKITFSGVKQGTIAKRIPTHIDANTKAQSDQRNRFKDAIDQWHDLTPEEQAEWETAARPHHLTGYQYFMSAELSKPPLPPLTLFEYLNEGWNSIWSLYGDFIYAQTFTPQQDHAIALVKLECWRVNLPGDLTVAIRATDAGGLPTGGNLAEVTVDSNTYISSTVIIFVPFTLPWLNLNTGTKYAIVFYAPGGDASNRIVFRLNAGGSLYPRGAICWSDNAGIDWTLFATYDFMFEEWGYAGHWSPPPWVPGPPPWRGHKPLR